MPFQKGQISWNKGIKIDRKKYPTMGFFGKHPKASKKTRKKMSLAHKEFYKNGGIIWDKGKKLSKDHIAKMRECNKGKKNYLWKGDDCTYGTLHDWVSLWLGKPTKCEDCDRDGLKGKQIHWANIDHKYKRNLSDWKRLCVPCHDKYDRALGLR